MLKIFDNGLIGTKHNDSIKFYMGSDTEQNLMSNLLKKPKDWYYRNVKLSYAYNNYGHRCKNLNKIDLDNYILFAGDSHTEGIGLELEKTYAYLLSNKLGTSYYNVGLGGTGTDVMLHNVITWISKYPKPKFVFMYWTEPTRFVKLYQNTKFLIPVLPRSNLEEDDNRVLVHGDTSGYFKTKNFLAYSLLSNTLDNLNIPFYNFYIGSDQYNFIPNINPILSNFEYDRARDGHFGIETHKAVVDHLEQVYKYKYSNAQIDSNIRGQTI